MWALSLIGFISLPNIFVFLEILHLAKKKNSEYRIQKKNPISLIYLLYKIVSLAYYFITESLIDLK